jgi:hypothetical protein
MVKALAIASMSGGTTMRILSKKQLQNMVVEYK